MPHQDRPVPEVLAGRSAAELEALFGRGLAPVPPPDGRRDGAFLAVGPLVGRAAKPLVELWQPWRGKRFEAASASGRNLLDRDAFELVRLLLTGRWFRWWTEDSRLFQALPFQTDTGPSALDESQDVLRIDYDLPENHPLVRRVLDEVVEVEAGVLLGQALLRGGGRHLRAAWFALW